jgi:hypothetical protein
MEEGDLTDALPADTPDAVRAEATSLLEMLLVYGVGAEAAKAKVAELYSPPRVTKELRKVRSMNLAAGTTFDMVADSAGRKWDFRRAEDRARARRLIAEEQPYLVIGSPPCTEFSRLNINLNKGRVAPRERQRRLAEGALAAELRSGGLPRPTGERRALPPRAPVGGDELGGTRHRGAPGAAAGTGGDGRPVLLRPHGP